ncbi:MAG: SRPBCC family protein [Polyangiaceae bacterium]
MDAKRESEPTMKNRTTVERKSEREVVVTRTINGPARLVFEAWTKPELFKRWWIPRSMGMTLLSCEMDIRVGGTYRLLIAHPSAPEPMAFFGKYLEVTPHSRLVWTNEEAGDNGAVSTVTFEEQAGKTVVVMSELYPSKAAFDENSGAEGGLSETFEQLEEFIATLSASES